MIVPNCLRRGDLVGIIAPASPPCLSDLQQGVTFLQSLDLYVQLGKRIDKEYGYLAGEDAERLLDFHEMIADPNIKAIIFARGGYGTGRFIDRLDYELIRKNPKVIWGYSDITYLHTAISQRSGLVTFHGPMVESDMAKDEVDEQTKRLFKQLFAPSSVYYSENISPIDVIVKGEVTGQLVGGNLTLLVSTLGTPYEVDTKGKILLIEDINEEPYRVDGMLNQLRLAGKLSGAAGIIVGDFAKATPKREPSLSLQEVFAHYFRTLSIPVMTGFKIGHCLPHIAVPLAVQAKMNTVNKTLIVQPGVKCARG